MKKKPSPFGADEIDAILDHFLHEDISLEEAEEAIQALKMVRPRAWDRIMALLGSIASKPAGLQPDPDSLLILLGCLGDAESVDEIVPLIDQEGLSDDLKLKLISVVHQLAPQRSIDSMLDQLQNPYLALQASQREHLKSLQTPGDIAAWLELMEKDMPPDMRLAFVQSVGQLDDPTAVPLLICMCYDADDRVALQAMDAVEHLKDARAMPALEELAAHHPVEGLRIQVRKTADRLGVRAALVAQIQPEPMAPVYACYLTTMDGSGGQIALVARQTSEEYLELADVMFNDHEGIKRCFGAEISAEDLVDMLESMSDDGISPVRVTHDQCMQTIDAACHITWQAGRLLPASYVAWRTFVQEGADKDAAEWPKLVVPSRVRAARLGACHELLLQDEFAFWFFNPDEIGDLDIEYQDMLARTDSQDKPAALRALLRKGVRGLITERRRKRVAGRLRKVAPLLFELYEDPEVWQWAVAAADAMEDPAGIELDTHPLLLGLVACSLENALREQVDWIDVV